MKRLFIIAAFFFIIASPASAQLNQGAQPNSIEVRAALEQNADITISEKISLDPNASGVYTRFIPKTFEFQGKTYNLGVDLEGVTTTKKTAVGFERDENPEFLVIIIDLPEEKTVKEYIINYTLSRVYKSGENADSVAFKVLGSKDDPPVKSVSVNLKSQLALVTEANCWAGNLDIGQKFCLREFEGSYARFFSTWPLGEGKEFIVTAELASENQIEKPSRLSSFMELLIDKVKDYWPSVLLVVAATASLVKLVPKVFYIKRGRLRNKTKDNQHK